MRPDEDPVSAGENLIAQGRAGEAAALLRSCVDSNRAGLLARLTLQKALIASGDSTAALAVARETALTHPGAAPAASGLGEALRVAGHLPTAIAEFQRALRLDPHLGSALIGLGAAWLDAGEAEKAIDAWRGIGETAPAALAERIAEAEAVLSRPRSDARYVRHLFDQFAVDYDSRMLDQLGYGAPAILREFAEMLGAGGRSAILDLGCGTGLMGQAVRDRANRLDGVDLSPAMVAKARLRGIYDELHVADICAWLAERGRLYDLIFAADTLVYLGDLEPVFAGVSQRLAGGGHFIFTVEKKPGDGFDLGPKRRWRHSESWLRMESGHAGLSVAGLMPCVPRSEGGVPVEGFAVALQK
ncbi:MAG: methyltransferase [Rhizomicrobium sp.]